MEKGEEKEKAITTYLLTSLKKQLYVIVFKHTEIRSPEYVKQETT